jgi:hypothetical protein
MHLESTHHLCATSRGGTNDPRNIPRINHKVHEALHRIFGNALPHEQVEMIVELAAPVLKEKYRDQIYEINRSGWMYQKGILRKF